MGKKGGKKENLDQDVENAEPNLSVIEEEDHHGEQEEEHPEDDKQRRSPNRSPKASLSTPGQRRKSRSILKGRLSTVTNPSKTFMIAEPRESIGMNASVTILVDQEVFGEAVEVGGKKGKGKKGKKAKKDKNENINGDVQQSSSSLADGAKKGKKGKKEKVEKGEQTEEVEKKDKKGSKGKKEKPAKESKETQKDVAEVVEERDGTKSENKLIRDRQSRVSFHQSRLIVQPDQPRRSIQEKQNSTMMLQEEEKKKKRRSSSSRMSMDADHSEQRLLSPRSTSRSRVRRKSSLRVDSILMGSDSHGRRVRRWVSASGISTDTDFSSDSSDTSSRIEKEEHGKKKKKKGKKDKKDKKEKEEEKETEPESEEDRERRKEEKRMLLEAKKAEKKAAKQAAKQVKKEAAAVTAAAKKEKPGVMDYDEVKKNLDELKKIAKGLGVELVEDTGEEKGPKKKMSKKEKARLTAEMAEKQKATMEAETKRIEELIKKKKEEDRLAAIEKDKKETLEQGIRIEQLKTSDQIIKDIIATNAEITKKEKDLLEWQKYVECGYLPNPTMVNQMNTYLHLWQLILDNTSMDVASKKSTDAIQLLNDLDELIDAVSEEERHKLENWKWVRQLFREYQSASLDVATYRLMRDVEHNLNRINIPTADFNFQDENVTLCVWLRVMLPIPLPNPRRPPKPRIDINFSLMNVNVLFPNTIDCKDAAIRAMYLKYDHFSDLCNTFHLPDVPKDYHMDLIEISKKAWRTKLKYKYDNRDKKLKQRGHHVQLDVQDGANISPENVENADQKSDVRLEGENDEPSNFDSDEEIPIVPFKQLKPTANEFTVLEEDKLYNETRAKLMITVPEHVINLRKFVILGGVYHLHLLAQPPQPQDFITMEMTITGLYLPKRLEVLPFKVVYTPYVRQEPKVVPPTSVTSFGRKQLEDFEEEQKKQDEELDKLISINIKWPQHVIFLELPIVCRWDEDLKHWSKEEIIDLKHNEEQCVLSFRTGVFGVYGLATYRYINLPFQAYDIKPETDLSITVQLTAAILMLEFNVKDGLISITQLQNSPNKTLKKVVGKYFKLHKLIGLDEVCLRRLYGATKRWHDEFQFLGSTLQSESAFQYLSVIDEIQPYCIKIYQMMKEAGIDIFPAFDAFCYVDGCCEKQWAMEKHLYYNMAQMSNSFNFAWSRWNLQAGRRRIVLQMRQYAPENKKQKSHQMLLVTPRKVSYIECTEVSQTFSEKDVESMKFSADLYHLMKATCGIFVRNKIMKASKQNVHTLAQFLISIRVMSFS